ncbi:MAG: peptidylprolyl isomerase [Wenzhouxiangella sp.]
MVRKLLIISIFAFLVGCQSDRQSGLVSSDDTLLVLVDGQPVTLPMLEYMMRARGIDENDHEGMRELLDDLIRLRAVANAAIDEGMDREPEVRARRMIRDMETLQLRFFDQVYRDHPVTEEDILAVYQSQLDRAGDRQFQIETLLFPDQQQALVNLARIEDGELDFDAMAAEVSGLGGRHDAPLWVDRSQVPEAIAALLIEAETGEVLSLPLQTPQGWRLLRLSDTRAVEAPPLDEVREGIARQLVRQRLEALVEDLYQGAEITPMLPLDEVSDQ